MNQIEKYNEFHDWSLGGIRLRDNNLELFVHFEGNYKLVVFKGVGRCLVNNFFIQNVICNLQLLDQTKNEDLYSESVHTLDALYPRRTLENLPIALINPSVGAEVIVEFSEFDVLDVSSK